MFWPYAYDSIFNDVFWPYAYDYDPFWDYGYGDIYTALFYPYSYDELLDVPPLPGGSRRAAIPERSTSPERGTSPGTRTMQKLATLCGDDAREVAGVPVDDIQAAVEPNDAQRAALDELGNAAIKAAQVVKDACPSDLALTPTGRTASMQRRIEAMSEAVQAVRDPLEKFYGMLNDEQKARFDAIGQRGGQVAKSQSLIGKCSVAAATEWPEAQIERVVRPTPDQVALLGTLKQAADSAAETLKSSCPAELPVTPSLRFAAISARLSAMLDAVKAVRGPLDDFYASLNVEQKAQFNNIGRQRVMGQR